MGPKNDSGTETITRGDTRVKEPSLFRVILLNDDYTTMDFVVAILETIFKKSPAEAVQIMLQVHQRGQGICGIFPKQIAEAKVALVHDRAQQEGHPLRCTLEEV
jgi:ATP-dependent Clp protease adaptor protein ClpS